jgi:hypothetical protein
VELNLLIKRLSSYSPLSTHSTNFFVELVRLAVATSVHDGVTARGDEYALFLVFGRKLKGTIPFC